MSEIYQQQYMDVHEYLVSVVFTPDARHGNKTPD